MFETLNQNRAQKKCVQNTVPNSNEAANDIPVQRIIGATKYCSWRKQLYKAFCTKPSEMKNLIPVSVGIGYCKISKDLER